MKKTVSFFLFLMALLPVFSQEGFIGEVRLFSGNFAPRTWAFCDGQILSISQNQALFSIVGTTYGGDGRTTFALPKLPGVPYRQIQHASTISKGGGGKVTFVATNRTSAPLDMYWVDFSGERKKYATIQAGDAITQVSGAGQVWHFVQGGELVDAILLSQQDSQSYIVRPAPMMKYIICTQGVFPSRN